MILLVFTELDKNILKYLGLVQEIENENVKCSTFEIKWWENIFFEKWRQRYGHIRQNNDCFESEKVFCKFL